MLASRRTSSRSDATRVWGELGDAVLHGFQAGLQDRDGGPQLVRDIRDQIAPEPVLLVEGHRALR